MKRSLRAMQDAFIRRPVAVLGGGPSLPKDLKRIPKDTILISVNHHAARIIDCHYMVFADDPIQWNDFYAIQKKYYGRRLSTMQAWSDFDFDCRKWYEGMSSSLATWFACHLTQKTVLLCGMDCYQGKDYFYDRKGYSARKETRKTLDAHIRPWLNAKIACRNGTWVIKAVSGPLIDVFGQYAT